MNYLQRMVRRVAILKAINTRKAGRKKLLEMVTYVVNPKKVSNSNTATDDAKKFIKESLVNRCLHGKRDCVRQMKHYVLSMAVEWPSEESARNNYEKKLKDVQRTCENYFMEKGYITFSQVHCNTLHPHFHMLVETCNAFDGKQYSQDKSDLAELKDYLNGKLLKYGLDLIMSETMNVSEDEMFMEDDEEYASDNALDESSRWNTGTLEQTDSYMANFNENWSRVENVNRREMCRFIPIPTKQVENRHEMCIVVSKSKSGREMCRIVPKGENKHEMCRITPIGKRTL